MATQLISTQYRLKRGLSEAWDRNNPVLAPGEPGWALDTQVLKIGDGKLRWSELQPVGDEDVKKQVAELIKKNEGFEQELASSRIEIDNLHDLAMTAYDKAVSGQNSAQNSAQAASIAQLASEAAAQQAYSSQLNASQSADLAEAAKQAAISSNTSAQAIANEAKRIASGVSDSISQLHQISSTGSIYDIIEINTLQTAGEDVKYLIFYGGSATELI